LVTFKRRYDFARFTLRAFLILALVVVGSIGSPAQQAAAAGAANDHTVLILGSTVSGGASSAEAAAAIANGMDVEVVNAAGWAAKTAADFATYRALILGDATCGGSATAAAANTAVWGAAVNGRVIIIGSDPVYHFGQGGNAYTNGGVKFVVGEPTKTGAYITLSCYYHGTAPMTPVPVLAGFGAFTVTGVGCYNNAHIVATHPALAGITDTTLSNWSCSVHEAFDSWPVTQFDVLAIARNIGSAFTASDGSTGTPYILARGVSVISDITLAPAAGSAAVGSSYTLTATVQNDGSPFAGQTVTFTAIGGPNNGLTLSGITNASGQATATYTGATAGTDTWIARFTAFERTQTSNRATVEWTAATPPTGFRPTVTASSPACGQIAVKATGVTPALPHQIVVTPSGGGALQLANVTADASQTVNATVAVSAGTYFVYVRMTSNQVTVSNTVTITVAACATPAPTPTPTPAPTPTPTPTPAAIGRLPSTATGDGPAANSALVLLGLLALGAIAWRRRVTRT
jgi:MYXO-CTERM domain-containing protein